MRLLRLLVLALALAGTTASQVRAQVTGVTLKVGAPIWMSRPPTDQLNNIVNRADCLAPDVKIRFAVNPTGTGLSDKLVEVWSGSDCATQTNRNENNQCVQVYTGQAVSKDVDVAVKDILQKVGNSAYGIGTGNDDTCDEAAISTAGTGRVLWFMVIDPASTTTPLAQVQWKFTYDLSPPKPPQNVVAGPGEESIVATFEASGDTDVNKYRIYCAEDEGGCTSSVLTADMDVSAEARECGSTNAALATQITGTGLMNGVSYAVALASEDKLGNVGKLSPLSCAVPQEVTGFYEAYRAAGGKAGGGFCTFAPARHGAGALFGLALAGLALLRRRR
jgi:hypothetical protein